MDRECDRSRNLVVSINAEQSTHSLSKSRVSQLKYLAWPLDGPEWPSPLSVGGQGGIPFTAVG
jgi:hypothetical protein